MASKANIYLLYTYEENCNTLSIYVSLEWTWKVQYPELRRNLKGIARGNSTKKLIHIIQEKQRGTRQVLTQEQNINDTFLPFGKISAIALPFLANAD